MVDYPQVSIAFPIYNPTRRYLAKALKSLYCQSFTNFEILLIDDGSHDTPFNDDLLFSDNRLRLIRHEENRGLANRLNEAIQLSRGKYVARMDDDDICSPNRLQIQYQYLETHPMVDLVASRCVVIDEDDNISGTLPYLPSDACVARRPWQGFHFAHPTWMGKKTWFTANPYAQPDPYRCEDQELLLRSHEHSSFYVIPEYLLAYRMGTKKGYSNNLHRTALAVFSFQVKYFIPRGRLLDAIFSLFVLLIKIIRVILTSIPISSFRLKKIHSKKSRPIDPVTATRWSSIINNL